MLLHRRLIQSGIALIIGCIIAFGFLYVQNNPRLFLGSVLEAVNPEMSRGDISYLIDTGVLYVFAKQSVQGHLVVDIRFDDTRVIVDPTTYMSLYDGKFTSLGSGSLRIQRSDIHLNTTDPIATIPFVAADPSILVSDAVLDNQHLIIERL